LLCITGGPTDGDVPTTGRRFAVRFRVVVRARDGLLVDGRE